MAAIATMGLSITTGHDACSPVGFTSASSTMTVNGNPVVCVGDTTESHGCESHSTHNGTVTTGSSIVTIDGAAVARVGDIVNNACPSSQTIATGDDCVNLD